MSYYELTYLISPEVNKEELKSLTEEVIDLIEEKGGEIKQKEVPEKRSLGSPISPELSEKEFSEVFLDTVTFYMSSKEVKDLKRIVKNKNNVLRVMLLSKQEPPKVKPKREKETKKKKVDLKDIEKKLDELL